MILGSFQFITGVITIVFIFHSFMGPTARWQIKPRVKRRLEKNPGRNTKKIKYYRAKRNERRRLKNDKNE